MHGKTMQHTVTGAGGSDLDVLIAQTHARASNAAVKSQVRSIPANLLDKAKHTGIVYDTGVLIPLHG